MNCEVRIVTDERGDEVGKSERMEIFYPFLPELYRAGVRDTKELFCLSLLPTV